jgi:hypothetical protein
MMPFKTGVIVLVAVVHVLGTWPAAALGHVSTTTATARVRSQMPTYELGTVTEHEWRAVGGILILSNDQMLAWVRLREQLQAEFLADQAEALAERDAARGRAAAAGAALGLPHGPSEFDEFHRQAEALLAAQRTHFAAGIESFGDVLEEAQRERLRRVAALIERRLTMLWTLPMMKQRAAAVDLEWNACLAWFERGDPDLRGRRFLDAHYSGYGAVMTPAVRRMASAVARSTRTSVRSMGQAILDSREGVDDPARTIATLEEGRAHALAAGRAEAEVSRTNVAWLRALPRDLRLPGVEETLWDGYAQYVLEFSSGPAPSFAPLRGCVADLRELGTVDVDAIDDFERAIDAAQSEVDELTHRMIMQELAYLTDTGALGYQGMREYEVRARHEAGMLSMSARRLELVHQALGAALESEWIATVPERRTTLEEGRDTLDLRAKEVRERLAEYRAAGWSP